MTQNAHLTNHWVFSLQFFCNDVCLLQEHQNTKHHVIWYSGWSAVDIWPWKVNTPRPIRHGRPDRALSSSGAVKSLQAGLPSNISLKRPCQGAHALGSCQNHTHFGPQITPSAKFHDDTFLVEHGHLLGLPGPCFHARCAAPASFWPSCLWANVLFYWTFLSKMHCDKWARKRFAL